MCTGIDRFSKARWESALEPATDPPYLCRETATRTNFVLGFGSQTNRDLPGHNTAAVSAVRVSQDYAGNTSSNVPNCSNRHANGFNSADTIRPSTSPATMGASRREPRPLGYIERDPAKILSEANRHMPAALGYGRTHPLFYPYIAPRFHTSSEDNEATIRDVVKIAQSNPCTATTRPMPPPAIKVNVDEVRVALQQRSETAPFDPCEVPPSLTVREALTYLGGRVGRLPSRVQYTQNAECANTTVSVQPERRSIALPRTACGYPKSRVELLHTYAKLQQRSGSTSNDEAANAHQSLVNAYLPKELRGDIDIKANDVRVTSTGKVIITPIPPHLREKKSKRDSVLGSTRLW